MKNCLKVLSLFILFLTLYFCITNKAEAAISTLSDTISTSRPSASTPIAENQAVNAGSVKIYDNGSMFLASDSGIMRPDAATSETLNNVVVASMSAANTPAAGQRLIYFSTVPATTHHNGDALTVPITAMHTVNFVAPTDIGTTDKIRITFPGTGDNTASPSASTFAFNGLTSTNVKTNNVTCSWSVAAPLIDCTPTSLVTAGTTITFLIGCSAATGASCTTQVPSLINPTKTSAAGTADTWQLSVKILDTNSQEKDSGKTKIATIESIQVQATVEPAFTFTIAGISNGLAVNTSNTNGCSDTETTNAGFATTVTAVDMGSIGQGISIAAQRITITTNANDGYSLTATSSGHLIDTSSGVWFNDSTTPIVMAAGTTFFGVHPCGMDVTAATWGNSSTTVTAGTGKVGWPTKTTAVTLASDSNGPIFDNSNGNGIISVAYAITASTSMPAAKYTSYITYVATPTF